MDIPTLRTFFMWCTILNGAVLLFSSFIALFIKDFAFEMNHKIFGISSREAFNTLMCSFVALYKVFVLTFNLVPYLALVLMG